MSDTDVLALYAGESKTVFAVLHYIDGVLLESETRMTDTPAYGEVSELLEEFLVRYYSGRNILPREIYLQHEIASMQTVSEWLSEQCGRKVYVFAPKRGEKLKAVEMASRNAMEKAIAAAVILGLLPGICQPNTKPGTYITAKS